MSVLLVIPARYASQRYPGKPLVPLKGVSGVSKTLIHRSWEAATKIADVDRVVVATDDQRISEEAEGFGAEVILTPETCRNGTERCAAALDALGGGYEVVVNLQGDAPLTPAWFVEPLIGGLTKDPSAAMATPVLRCTGAMLNDLRAERAAGRVGGTTAVVTRDGGALYFSKEVLPFIPQVYEPRELTPVLHHVGVYAYRASALADYASAEAGAVEQLEGLEQLRFLEMGQRIACVEVEARGRPFWELNNPEDVPKIEAMLKSAGLE